LRSLIASGAGGANDVVLHDNVGRSSDHQQVLDIVAAHQNQPSTSVDCGGIDYRQTGHASAIGIDAEAISRESPHEPGGPGDQRQDHNECDDECDCLHAVFLTESAFNSASDRRMPSGIPPVTIEPWPSLLIPPGKNCRRQP
jgi:hypothetical protein